MTREQRRIADAATAAAVEAMYEAAAREDVARLERTGAYANAVPAALPGDADAIGDGNYVAQPAPGAE